MLTNKKELNTIYSSCTTYDEGETKTICFFWCTIINGTETKYRTNIYNKELYEKYQSIVEKDFSNFKIYVENKKDKE